MKKSYITPIEMHATSKEHVCLITEIQKHQADMMDERSFTISLADTNMHSMTPRRWQKH